MALCIFIWFEYGYQPLSKRIDALQKEQSVQPPISAEDLTEKITALRTDLSAKTLTPSHDDHMNAVLGYIEHAGLVLENCSMQDKALYVQALGTYKQCQVFFEQLTSSKHPLLPRDIRITRGNNNLFSLSVAIE